MGSQLHGPAALPKGKRPGTHFKAGWMGHGFELDGSGKSRKLRDSKHGPTSPQQVPVRTTVSRPHCDLHTPTKYLLECPVSAIITAVIKFK